MNTNTNLGGAPFIEAGAERVVAGGSRNRRRTTALILGLAAVFVVSGCRSPLVEPAIAPAAGGPPEIVTLQEGDVVQITFPGAPDLNTAQQVRRDGRISLPMLGEFEAAGLQPGEMEEKLVDLYGPQLQTKTVNVSIASSVFPVYVTGAVLQPGKITLNRSINALEAVMEAGGFDYTRADLKKVAVIRRENDRMQRYTLNLKQVLNGEQSRSFRLRPFDIIYVPARFTWF